MKKIDIDVHVASEKWGFAITVDELIELMDANDVETSVAWPMLKMHYTMDTIRQDNKVIGEGAKKYSGRIAPFGGLNPLMGMKESFEEMNRCISEYNVKGFKLSGARDGYKINDRELVFPIVEKIAKEDLIFATHIGADSPVNSHPFLLRDVAQAFPEVRIILIHMGGAGVPKDGLYDAAIQVAQECSNIWVAPSESDPRAMIKAIKTLDPERICFASDNPFAILRVSIAIYNAVLEEFDQETKERIMYKNAKKLLRL